MHVGEETVQWLRLGCALHLRNVIFCNDFFLPRWRGGKTQWVLSFFFEFSARSLISFAVKCIYQLSFLP